MRKSYEVKLEYPDGTNIRVTVPELPGIVLLWPSIEEIEKDLPNILAFSQQIGPRAYPTEPKR